MDKEIYHKIISLQKKKTKKKNYLYAFFMGGFISFLGELINLIFINMLNIEKENSVILVIFIFILIGSILTGLGIFDNLVQIFGAGLFIPTTGFANSITSSAIEGRDEGYILGIGGQIFALAGSVITYAIVASIVFLLIKFIINFIEVML